MGLLSMDPSKNSMPYKLSNGVTLPSLGFGITLNNLNISLQEHRDKIIENIKFAVNHGIYFIDTAWSYKTEEFVGIALNLLFAEGLKREDVFVQTKFYPQMPYGYHEVINQFNDSLSKLGLEYIDAYLFHQPIPRYAELEYKERNSDSWKAFEYLYNAGKVKAIGVSNFLERHIDYLSRKATIFPMINQLEINPFFQQRGLSEWCRSCNICVQSWGPLAHGKAIDNEVIKKLADKYNVTVSQFCLKWNVQMHNIPIFFSSNPENIKSNTSLDFFISENDMEIIRSLNTCTNHRETWWYPRQMMY